VRRFLPLLTLAATVLSLTAYGAGIFLWTTCVALLAMSLLAIAARPNTADARPGRTFRVTPTGVYLASVILLATLMLPLPLALTRLTGAARYEQNRTVTETLTEARALGADAPALMWFSITRNRAGTLRALLLLATLFGVWHTSVRMETFHRQAWIRILIITGAVVAVLGHLGKWVFPQGDTLWWCIPVPHALPGPVGGFINPNHFAGFIAMLAPVALAHAAVDARNQRWLLMFVDVTAFATMTVALLFSMSRGGLVAYAGGILTLAAITAARSRLVGRLWLAAALAITIGAGTVLAFQYEPVRERLLSLRSPATTASLQERMQAWKDTAAMWRRYPVFGVGPNAFLVTFPQHRTTSSRAARDFAENEYVQIIGETGLVGAVLLALLLVMIGKHVRAGLKSELSPLSEHAPAAVSAIAVAATHALVDFPLHLPLYAITVTSLLGFLWSPHTTQCRYHAAKWPHFAGIAVALGVLLLGSKARLDAPGLLSGADTPTTTRALVWAPTSSLGWRRLCAKLSQEESEESRQLGERCLTQAAIYDPNNYPLWRRLGEVRQALGDNRGANQAYRRVEALRDWIKLPVLPEE
jgi:hypothetical protein